MAKYIQTKDGKFAGSIGDGKSITPTASNIPSSAYAAESKGPDTPDYDALAALVREQQDAATAARQVEETAVVATAAAIDLDLHQYNDSFPVPQADSLAKVALAVDAISAGADTDDALAHALRVTDRQGSYYGSALGSLGLAYETGDNPRTWALTSGGEQFLNADPATRAVILEHTVEQIPEVRAYLNDGSDIEDMLADRYSDDTASRRAKSLQGWVNTVTNRDKAIRDLTLENDAGRPLLAGAAQIASDARRAARERAATRERPIQICQRCFMATNALGQCDNCDD